MNPHQIHQALQQVCAELRNIEATDGGTFTEESILRVETAYARSQIFSLERLRAAMTTFNQLQVGQYPHAIQVFQFIRETRLPQAMAEATEALDKVSPVEWKS